MAAGIRMGGVTCGRAYSEGQEARETREPYEVWGLNPGPSLYTLSKPSTTDVCFQLLAVYSNPFSEGKKLQKDLYESLPTMMIPSDSVTSYWVPTFKGVTFGTLPTAHAP